VLKEQSHEILRSFHRGVEEPYHLDLRLREGKIMRLPAPEKEIKWFHVAPATTLNFFFKYNEKVYSKE
jgi:hypothetical protein